MWPPIVFQNNRNQTFNFFNVINGNNPAIIVKNFYSKEHCSVLVKRILTTPTSSTEGRIKTIGPFLMSFATKKEQYFEQSAYYDSIFSELFSNLENPLIKTKNFLSCIFPSFSLDFASENDHAYSKCIIRIHEKNDFAPIHKDNVSYEGVNYAISKINFQISCVLHLQDAKKGGELIIYKKQWKKDDESYRKIDFGYNEKFLDKVQLCKISPEQGDLIIINPNYFHGVNKIIGEKKRITLGMFVGFDMEKRKAVIWA